MAGRKPAPTAVKIAKGVANGRINFKEPKFKPVTLKDSDPPEYLNDVAAEEWRRVFADLKESGVLVRLNRNVLAGYCSAFANWKRAQILLNKKRSLSFRTPNGAFQQVPEVGIVNQGLIAMLKYASEFGMTPSSRSRIMAKDPEEGGNNEMIARLMSGGSSGGEKK